MAGQICGRLSELSRTSFSLCVCVCGVCFCVGWNEPLAIGNSACHALCKRLQKQGHFCPHHLHCMHQKKQDRVCRRMQVWNFNPANICSSCGGYNGSIRTGRGSNSTPWPWLCTSSCQEVPWLVTSRPALSESKPFDFTSCSPPDRKRLLDFMLESAFAMLLHHPPHALSRQSSSPVEPAEYPARAARQWITPSIPPEQLASGSRRVSCQS